MAAEKEVGSRDQKAGGWVVEGREVRLKATLWEMLVMFVGEESWKVQDWYGGGEVGLDVDVELDVEGWRERREMRRFPVAGTGSSRAVV